MQRLRLKADGRIVELRDGQEFPLAPVMPELATRFNFAQTCLMQRRAKPARCRPCVTFAAARS